jgi:signal peptidase
MRPGIRAVRRFVLGLWLVAVIAVLALVGVSRLGPLAGYQLVIIKGASMQPTIPLGALAFETTPHADQVVPGAVVTMTLPNGTVVTHRVLDVTEAAGRPVIQTKGDGNASADPNLEPVASVTGIVVAHLPALGFVLAWLQIPSGLLSVLALLAGLFTCLLLLEDLEDGDVDEEERAVKSGMTRLEA